MTDAAVLNDIANANVFNAAKQQSRLSMLRASGSAQRMPQNIQNTAQSTARAQTHSASVKTGTQELSRAHAPEDAQSMREEAGRANELNRFNQIIELERRAKQLKNSAIKDEATADTLAVSNNFVDMAASGLIEAGKATLEILIGFLILPAGFILKIIKFGFDRQITSLKSNSKKKNEEGEKLTAQAEKLKGRHAPLKRAADMAIDSSKNFIKELLVEFFPLGISPLDIASTMEEKKQLLNKLILRGAVFFTMFTAGLAFIVFIIVMVFNIICELNFATEVACKIISPITFLKIVAK